MKRRIVTSFKRHHVVVKEFEIERLSPVASLVVSEETNLFHGNDFGQQRQIWVEEKR